MGLVTLAVVAASSGLALGVGAFSIKISVPTSVPGGKPAVIKVHGHAASVSGESYTAIDLYTATAECKDKHFDEGNLRAAKLRLGHVRVTGAFSKQYDLTEDRKGTYHACAYLYILPKDQEVAHAAASWKVK